MKHLNIYHRIAALLSIMILSFQGNAQQDPQFTHYMYNMSVINPAYATAEEGILNLGGLYRTQWVGLEGAPKTGSFFAHTPINDKIEMGISFTNDNIGDVVNENNIYADVAYVLPVGLESKLSFGLKAGVTLFDTNFNGFQLQSGGSSSDEAFDENISKAFPNLGIGAFFFTDSYYLGLSAPNMLSTKHLENENGIAATGVQNVHYFLTGGYVFDLNKDLKLKPAFMARGVKGAPMAIDVTANVLINEKLEAGLGYRLGDAMSALVNFRITPELKVGYAYDYTTSNLGDFNSGSHEIFILFDVDLFGFKSGYDRSPRFF
ncbi:type IX secretion system membrane protein PorP/SprF [Algibacter amylolyticus]|uniref:Type IX secretion system membrane protein PorP/SprF n=1 Tax=Algibacter amylolyticus TaxID=1608400 RepID=A0A5M7BDQ4_9FLAO|nr:type IX secretion system membrane protein PorP/SprF [Algibacter amylolyticus]KAA5827766.1 type IX secretion system membrane protein PorP/SprF [Algibacter amylolyticus]MBB5266992.1 type IX secretion system PorP/SprF family membrane protein [Algibacter amylolyticus]TSJ82011.1 type IX secretion system membrane protein PorP/SprF [Algibacter amylolyticus]